MQVWWAVPRRPEVPSSPLLCTRPQPQPPPPAPRGLSTDSSTGVLPGQSVQWTGRFCPKAQRARGSGRLSFLSLQGRPPELCWEQESWGPMTQNGTTLTLPRSRVSKATLKSQVGPSARRAPLSVSSSASSARACLPCELVRTPRHTVLSVLSPENLTEVGRLRSALVEKAGWIKETLVSLMYSL